MRTACTAAKKKAASASSGHGCGHDTAPCEPVSLYPRFGGRYERGVMRSTLSSLLAIALLPGLAVAGPKDKKPAAGAHPMTETANASMGPTGKASVCGVKVFPLSVGNEWTYVMVPSPLPPDDQLKRISPTEPNQIVVKVTAIDVGAKGGDTIVKLDEKITIDLTKDPKKPVLDERTIHTTITCNAKKFEISPDSFFFAGEPGGYINLTLDSIERPKGTSWQLANGAIGEAQWREDLVAKWTRHATEGSEAKLGSGKLELERQFTPQPQEGVSTKAGAYVAEKLGLVTTGRVTLDGAAPDAKPMELPANWVTQIWIAPGAGVVQTLNPYMHMYQLQSATLK